MLLRPARAWHTRGMGVYNDSTPVPPAGYRRLGPERPLKLPLAPWVPYLVAGYQNQYSMLQPRHAALSWGTRGPSGAGHAEVRDPRAHYFGEFSVEGPGWGWMAAAILVSAAAGVGAGYYAGRKRKKRRK